jgi:hypothetical protein
MSAHQLWFRSTAFEIESGEDSETNPLCYGRQLSRWLRDRLMDAGRSTAEVIPEDWGWCVMVQRKPFLLWVGCVSVHDYAKLRSDDPAPSGADVVWTCNVVAEKPLLSNPFRRIDAGPDLDKLFEQVRGLVEADPRNTMLAEPQ